MIKELAASVITMGFMYFISFAVYADEQNIKHVNTVKFYDIPQMLGKQKSITVDLQQDHDVYLWKMDKPVDETDLNAVNLRLADTNLLDYILPAVYDQKSKDLNIVATVNTFTAKTNIPDWNALVIKPKKLSDPGYIYYYSNGYLYEVDIFFNGEPDYLRKTIVESLNTNGYDKTFSGGLLFNDIYNKGSSLVTYKYHTDQFTSIDNVTHYSNYSYIRFRNTELMDMLPKMMTADLKSVEYQKELQHKLGL